MDNKKFDVLFGLVIIAFLVVTLMLIRDFNVKRASDLKQYSASISNIVRIKDNKIKFLASQLAAQEKENADLKNTLAATKNDLDALTKKLAQPAPVAAVAK